VFRVGIFVLVFALGLDFARPARAEHYMVFDGFVLQRPADEGWTEGIWTEPTKPVIFLNTRPDGAIESLSVSAFLVPLSGPERRKIEEKLEVGVQQMLQVDRLRIRPAPPLKSVGGTAPVCVQFYGISQEIENPNYEVIGWSCRHPFNIRLMVSLIYWRPTLLADRPNALQSDADIFLNHFVFIPAEMDWVVADTLDEFAKRLQQDGRTDDAEETGRHANLLRESARSEDSSFFLGFNPADDLSDYAEFLENHGDTVASREVEEISERANANNMAAYVCFSDLEGCIAKVRTSDTRMLIFDWED